MAGGITSRPLNALLECVIDHPGRTPKKLGGDFVEAGIRVISAKNVKDGRIDFSTEIRHVTAKMFNDWMPNKLRTDDVLLTSEAPLGEVAYLGNDSEFCLGQRLFALRADRDILHGRYLYYFLLTNQAQHRLHARATGTTRKASVSPNC